MPEADPAANPIPTAPDPPIAPAPDKIVVAAPPTTGALAVPSIARNTPAACKEVKRTSVTTPVLLLLMLALICLIGWLSGNQLGLLGIGSLSKPAAFGFTMVLLAVFSLLAGKSVTGLWLGLFVDGRNRVSLSRLQTAVWTVVVLAAILVAAFSNAAIQSRPKVITDPDTKKILAPGSEQANLALGLPKGGPVDFAIPGELWALLGISVTSLIGSPLLLNMKKEKPASAQDIQRATRALAAADDINTTNQGQLLVRACPEDARWEDLFQAEEVGNGAHLDLAKIQNLYFTVVVVVAYAEALFSMFAADKPITQFPTVSEGMVALLAISHATYLANKAQSHSQESDGTANNSGAVDPASVKKAG